MVIHYFKDIMNIYIDDSVFVKKKTDLSVTIDHVKSLYTNTHNGSLLLRYQYLQNIPRCSYEYKTDKQTKTEVKEILKRCTIGIEHHGGN